MVGEARVKMESDADLALYPSDEMLIDRPIERRSTVPSHAKIEAATQSLRDLSVATARIETIDAARIIAMLGILIIHAIETPWLAKIDYIGTFGVPFYLFASLYFQARSFREHPDRQIKAYIGARMKRLYLPFLAWTAIYLVARNLKHVLLLHHPMLPMKPAYLLAGTAHHLWFLPMLVIVTILTGILGRFCSGNPRLRWIIIVSSSIIGSILAIVPRPEWFNYARGDNVYFLYQSWKTLPSVFLGLALAWWMAWQPRKLLINPAIGFAGLLMTTMMIGNQIVSGYSRMDRTLSGFGWLIVALADWRGAWVSILARFGKRAFGMYLSHVLFIEGIQAIAHASGYGISLGLDALSVVGSFIGAAVTTLLIARTPRLRWLNGD